MAGVDCRSILRMGAYGMSRRQIAASLKCSRDSVTRVLKRAEQEGITWLEVEALGVKEAEQLLFPERGRRGEFVQPDFEHVHAELAKPSVSLMLLYEEYRQQCIAQGQMFYCYSQFCNKYRDYAKRTKATMRLVHKPGDTLEIDWAGDTLAVHDEFANVVRKVHLFVACLPYSQLIYAEAFPDMKTESWLTANVHALEYIGGVPAGIRPDNLKTGVSRNTGSTVVIAPAYQDLAEYYGTVIQPARVRAPKDKASVERSVGICETWVIAGLRDVNFTSVEEMNSSIRSLVDELNERPFQKKEGSRRSVFENEEKTHLSPLPEIPYEVPDWKTITVQPDYLVETAGCRYSVPYEYIGQKVRVRTLRKTVDVFFEGMTIASHIRKPPQKEAVYKPEHMPMKHRQALAYTEDNCRQWAQEAGGSIAAVADALLSSSSPAQHKTRECADLMKLADKYSLQRLEKACQTALSASSNPSTHLIGTLLREGREAAVLSTPEPPVRKTHGLTRGKDYYKKGANG